MLRAHLRLIKQLSALNSAHLFLMVKFMSGLDQRCTQRQFHSVADCLVQQMEFVSQPASESCNHLGSKLKKFEAQNYGML